MKSMKKLFALVMAVAMVASMAVTSGAIDATPMTNTSTVTILGAAAGRTYKLYRIFDLAATDGATQNTYITNSTWEDFAESREGLGRITLSNGFVKTVTSDLGNDDAVIFANAALEWANTNGIDPDMEYELSSSGAFPMTLQYGFYVMLSSRGEAPTVFTVNETTETINEKNDAIPNIKKEVQEDSKIGDANNGFGPSNVAEIAQDVQFRLVLTTDAGTDTYTIEDSMPNFTGLSINSITYSAGEINTTDYTLTQTDNSFTIVFTPSFRSSLKDAQTITILYSAKLADTATVADSGNKNTATFTFDSTEQEEKTTTTYTCHLEVLKYNENNEALAGATFQLLRQGGEILKFKPNGNGHYIVSTAGDAVDSITTDATGKFYICGLDTVDVYTLKETAAPEGYIILDPQTVVIDESNNHSATITLHNLPGVSLPETGGMGTTLFYVGGGALVLCAMFLLISKKRAR